MIGKILGRLYNELAAQYKEYDRRREISLLIENLYNEGLDKFYGGHYKNDEIAARDQYLKAKRNSWDKQMKCLGEIKELKKEIAYLEKKVEKPES